MRNISKEEHKDDIASSPVLLKKNSTKITSILYGSGELKSLNKNLELYTLLVRPNFGCSTKSIYKEVKYFSRPIFNKKQRVNLNYKFLSNLKNDLEEPAFEKYPVLKKLKIFMEKIDDILFARMTGSGSTIIGYFNSKKAFFGYLCRHAIIS